MEKNNLTRPIRTLIAEDVESLCRYYTQILNKDPEITVVSSVYDGSSAITSAFELKPDVILMDIEMDTKDAGLLATKEILSKLPDTKIIILTVYEEDEMVSSAFTLGACDYMLKNCSQGEIVKGVKDAFLNQSTIRPEIAPKLRSEFQRVKQYESSFLYVLNMLTVLTPTEVDILYLLSKNYSRADICKMRCVEMSTVKTQIHNILQKLGKKNISEVLISIQHTDILDLVLKVKNTNESK